jgi:O-antigen ligase
VNTWGATLPTSLHNAWLEVAYNNGLLGLTMLAMLNLSTVACLWRATRQLHRRDRVNRIVYGVAISLYAASLINSAAGVYFGGVPHKSFVLYLTAVGMAQILAYSKPTQLSAERAAPARPLFYRMAEGAGSSRPLAGAQSIGG